MCVLACSRATSSAAIQRGTTSQTHPTSTNSQMRLTQNQTEQIISADALVAGVAYLPGCHLSAQHIAGLVHCWNVACVNEVFRSAQAGKTGSNDGDLEGFSRLREIFDTGGEACSFSLSGGVKVRRGEVLAANLCLPRRCAHGLHRLRGDGFSRQEAGGNGGLQPCRSASRSGSY